MCRNQHEVAIPEHLINELTSGNVVVFAGAGVSTETDAVFSWTLYEDIRNDLGLPVTEKPDFPRLMEMFCQRPDGRQRLLEKIEKRLSYVSSFPELYRLATRFHREISTLFYMGIRGF